MLTESGIARAAAVESTKLNVVVPVPIMVSKDWRVDAPAVALKRPVTTVLEPLAVIVSGALVVSVLVK
jgi:hypothetical protein